MPQFTIPLRGKWQMRSLMAMWLTNTLQPHHIAVWYHMHRSQNNVSDFRLCVCSYHTHHTNVKSDCTRRRMTRITAKPWTVDNEKCHWLKLEFSLAKRSFAISVFAKMLGVWCAIWSPKATDKIFMPPCSWQENCSLTIKPKHRRVNKSRKKTTTFP